MNILFSGGSSFTGTWFCRELVARGHNVVATCTQPGLDGYSSLRRRRVEELDGLLRLVFECRFGEAAFLDLVASQSWDAYCHHAAEVTDYKSPDFDAVAALTKNTHGLADVLSALTKASCPKLVLTGSVFEGGEGAGSDGLPHFSPYGLSKSLTWQVFQYESQRQQMALNKFVIPNPVGPLEDPRFTTYLMSTWRDGGIASVQTPDYVRDNIAVDLLAMEYADLVENQDMSVTRRSPSGWVGPQGLFAQRIASAMKERLGWACELELPRQTTFSEPMVRINTQPSASAHPIWSEERFWDSFAEFYTQPAKATLSSSL